VDDLESEQEITDTATPADPAVPELSRVLVLLLKGVLYREDDEPLWGMLLRLQTRVREHAAVLLLNLVIDEAEGYAFLKARPEPDDTAGARRQPRLVARRPLSYPVSLLLVLLRKRLAELDAGGGDIRLVLSREEVVEQVRLFLPPGPNEARVTDQIDTLIGKVTQLGFLRPLKPEGGSPAGRHQYEVRRILKAYIDAQWLSDFASRLEAYRRGGEVGFPDESIREGTQEATDD
jgi:hypothetical protein